MADYWVKLYTEIIDDPKMAVLPDRLWRRAIEAFLLAGKLSRDKSGQLPETDQLAWLLRMNPDDLEIDLTELEKRGLMIKNKDGWLVKNFAKRQAPVTDAQRKMYQRKREKSRNGHESGHVMSRTASESQKQSQKQSRLSETALKKSQNLDGITPFDMDREIEISDLSKIYMNVTGIMTLPLKSDQRDSAIEALYAIQSEHGENSETYLRTFFDAWVNDRGYNKTNPGWLDWAVAGEIPKKRFKKGDVKAPDPTEIYE